MNVLKKFIKPIWNICPYSWKQRYRFKKLYGYFPNLKLPQIMDEKLLALKNVYGRSKKVSLLTDKYEVRNYLTEHGYGNLLNQLYQACDTPEEINWNLLPNRYVIKCNHGCGYNIIVDGKTQIDKSKVSRQLTEWLNSDFSRVADEKQYKAIKPKIIIEKYLETADGHFPPDYKFFTSWGGVIGCMICADRDDKVKRIFVDELFEDTHFIHEYERNDYKKFKPESWDKMLKIAAELGKNFPFVRVDLYDSDGKIVFGELTFTPNTCLHGQFSIEGQKYIGERIHLEKGTGAEK